MDLAKIVAEMRALGVTRYRSGDLEIDLGPAPAAPLETPENGNVEQLREQMAAAERLRRRNVLFAATNFKPRSLV